MRMNNLNVAKRQSDERISRDDSRFCALTSVKLTDKESSRCTCRLIIFKCSISLKELCTICKSNVCIYVKFAFTFAELQIEMARKMRTKGDQMKSIYEIIIYNYNIYN